ncbi:MAG: MotA/TolQ/ExbB proton channel family protein [Alcanivoracaceae bacterium]|nr:MotA/TolQ/ExbB proton channel family protein [Alcanivoracaceae bacterium]
MKKTLMTLLVTLIVTQSVSAMTLTELVDVVRRSATESSAENKQRVEEFKGARDQQQRLLTNARNTLKSLERHTNELKSEFDENEKSLADLETVLHERSGNLGEMQGTVKILSGDLRSRVDNSLTSAQFPGRSKFLTELASQKKLPTITELKRLWLEMTHEISEQAKIVKFSAPVLNGEGEIDQNVEVIRLGTFNAFDMNGNFLIWSSEGLSNKGVLYRLPKQPTGKYKGMANTFVKAAPGSMVYAPIDYTKGTILQMVVQTPSWKDKIKEGKEVGYVIIGLGAFGLLLALWKFLSLFISGAKINKQLKSKTPNTNNALGRIMHVYTDSPDSDIETMELKMDEAILRETAPLEGGLSFIKVMYVIAPLLGLLGTVVGMIGTFQMITLFGTGDPKSMAGGISQALVTTVLGLVVAIPLTILHSVLQSMARKQTQILEEQSAGIIARLAEK